MFEYFPTGATFAAFVAASLVLAITPGPVVLFVVMRSITQGRSMGVASVLGGSTGSFFNLLAAVLGLATLLEISAAAFTFVKWAGALYLLYLGVRELRAALKKPQNLGDLPGKSAVFAPQVSEARAYFRVYCDAVVVGLFNPKTALFFIAFLPQFMRTDVPYVPQALGLGISFIAIATCTDMLYALLASTLAPLVKRNVQDGRKAHFVLGITFIGLGILAALVQRPPAKP